MKVGLALSAGAARGLAHLGVLEVFQEHDIPIHVIAGTSMGALIGGLYASGVDLAILSRMAQELEWNDLVSFTITKLGLVSSERIYQMLKLLTKGKHFEDLEIPTAVVATDINTGEEIVIDSGPIADGIRASISIPGVFVPVIRDDRMLVDGALVNRVPATVARKLGADLVIGVDVGLSDFRGRANNLADIILRTIDTLERECAKLRVNESDILISPKLNDVGTTQLNRATEIIERGRQAARAVIDEIKVQLR